MCPELGYFVLLTHPACYFSSVSYQDLVKRLVKREEQLRSHQNAHSWESWGRLIALSLAPAQLIQQAGLELGNQTSRLITEIVNIITRASLGGIYICPSIAGFCPPLELISWCALSIEKSLVGDNPTSTPTWIAAPQRFSILNFCLPP